MRILGRVSQSTKLQVAGVAVATVFLTAAFVGVLALFSGATGGLANRLSLYVLVAGIVFVSSIVTFSRRGLDGGTVLLGTVGLSLVAGLLVLLAGEGLRYAIVQPSEVFQIHILAYFAAAGLVVIGLTYWTLRYWREILARRTAASEDTE